MPEKCGCAALVDGNFPAAHVPVRMCPLHAAAPDLLAACKKALGAIMTEIDNCGETSALDGAIPVLTEAILKADGGE